jgi:hypothetical protein
MQNETELTYAQWLASLPFHAFHNEYNAMYSIWKGSVNNYEHDTEEKMGALRQEEKRRGADVQIGPEMAAGDEY